MKAPHDSANPTGGVLRGARRTRQAMYSDDGKLSVLIVHHLLALLERDGGDPQAVLAEAGLAGRTFDNPSEWVSQALCRQIILAARRLGHDTATGLRLSQITFPTGFGIIGHIAQASPTLSEIINTVNRYECLLGDIFTSTLDHEPGTGVWTLAVREPDPLANRFMVDFGLGARHMMLLLVRDRRSNILVETRFAYPPPPAGERALYEKVFGCPVHFDQPHSGLVFRSSALNLPLQHLDQGLKPALEQEADRQIKALRQEKSVAAHARERLAALISQGTASREALAASLGISSRHLHRELDNEGTSYSALLDDLRLARAEELLSTPATLEEIGRQLGFREASSFMRWYRKKTGHTARNTHSP